MSTPLTDMVLETRRLSLRAGGKLLIRDLDWCLRKAEVWALCGPGGSGKSLLLEAILGRATPAGGQIRRVFCETYQQLHPQRDPHFSCRSLMALVSFHHRFTNRAHQSDFYYQQRFHSWDSEQVPTLREYLQGILEGLPLEPACEPQPFPMDWVIRTLHLESLLDKELIKLSNGETRRSLLAAALLQQPRLLLLDNLFSGLDAGMRAELAGDLAELSRMQCQLILVADPAELPEAVTHVLELDPCGEPAVFSREDFDRRRRSRKPAVPEASSGLPLPPAPAHSPFQRILRMQGVQVRYSDTVVLQDIDWEVAPGEAWALLGDNGAGKSTLLSLIAGDNPQAYANDIWLFDRKRGSGESIWDIKRHIGYLSSELHQYFRSSHSLQELVLAGLSDRYHPAGAYTADQQDLALRWLELLGLGHLATRTFDRCSSSQQRLCLLARALIRQPALLILDEPFQGLDGPQKQQALALLERLIRSRQQTLIYVSHYRQEFPVGMSHHLWLRAGRIWHMGPGLPFGSPASAPQ